MSTPGRPILNLAGAIAAAAMIAFALYSQHVLLLDPCPLCIFQRIFVIALGAVFLLAAVHNPIGRFRHIYTGLIAVIAAAGAAVAAWHVHIQNLPPDEVPACGPGFDYIVGNFPMADALSMIFTGSGQCAEVSWRFVGLSMPTWVVILVVLLGIAGVWNNQRALTSRLQ